MGWMVQALHTSFSGRFNFDWNDLTVSNDGVINFCICTASIPVKQPWLCIGTSSFDEFKAGFHLDDVAFIHVVINFCTKNTSGIKSTFGQINTGVKQQQLFIGLLFRYSERYGVAGRGLHRKDQTCFFQQVYA